MNLLMYPDSTLVSISKPVDFEIETKATLEALLKNLHGMLEQFNGVGFSAIQMGVPLRVCVIKVKDGLLDLVNPTLLSTGGSKEPLIEGCLSLPGVIGQVDRHTEVTVNYFDTEGFMKTIDLWGIEAQIAQHEIDHMDGLLWVDRLKPMAKDMAIKKGLKIRRKVRADARNFKRLLRKNN